MITEDELLSVVEGLSSEELELCLAQGWVTPSRREEVRYYLEVDVARVRLIRELRVDLGVEEETIPVLLSLIDQIHALRSEMRDLLGGIARQPEDVRARIAETIAELHRRRDGGTIDR